MALTTVTSFERRRWSAGISNTNQLSSPSRVGLISVFDLANVGSAVHLLTEDLGIAEGDGFRLLGRAAGAELRGCSLVVEELR